jgi:hypothetical protein
MISELAQPSNIKNKIHLRGATVKQAMSFSDVVEAHSERITTEFLNAVQTPESFTDSAKWTEADRLTALFWYHIHTVKDSFVSLSYECSHCKKPHDQYFDSRLLAEPFNTLQGKPYREVEILNKQITFEPLNGGALEAIQAVKRALVSKGVTNTQIKNEIALERLIRSFHFTHSPAKSVDDLREWALGLEIPEYWELMAASDAAQESLKHGVPYQNTDGDVCFICPPHKCINTHLLAEEQKEGAVSQLLWPFLCGNFIPTLQPR